MSDSDEPADRPLRILHVTPAFYPATYWGGPIFSTYGLCNALAAQEGIDVTVLTTDSAGPGRDDRLQISATPERYSAGYDVHFVRKSRGKDIAPRMFGPLKQLARQADILHLTATYSFPTFPVFFAARQLNKPLVWSPRGAIQATAEWGAVRRRRLKQAWAKLARVGLPKQTLFHTTADVERDACAEAFPGVPAIVVPNGV
ncbi:MAG: glycosyltransferase, partial [Pseudomonadota bacterium]